VVLGAAGDTLRALVENDSGGLGAGAGAVTASERNQLGHGLRGCGCPRSAPLFPLSSSAAGEVAVRSSLTSSVRLAQQKSAGVRRTWSARRGAAKKTAPR